MLIPSQIAFISLAAFIISIALVVILFLVFGRNFQLRSFDAYDSEKQKAEYVSNKVLLESKPDLSIESMTSSLASDKITELTMPAEASLSTIMPTKNDSLEVFKRDSFLKRVYHIRQPSLLPPPVPVFHKAIIKHVKASTPTFAYTTMHIGHCYDASDDPPCYGELFKSPPHVKPSTPPSFQDEEHCFSDVPFFKA